MMKKKKVGIMGGTFDPIHNGHLILAQTAMEQYQLDEILFMPSRTPPHKSSSVTEASHRIAMTSLAIKNHPGFTLSLFEMDRQGYTYTCETLRLLTEQHPDISYYFLMGEDSLFDFAKWRDPGAIAALCRILVANRNEQPDRQLLDQIDQIKGDYGADVELLRIPALEISSHVLRKMVGEGRSIHYYTPEAVVSYIENNGLYR